MDLKYSKHAFLVFFLLFFIYSYFTHAEKNYNSNSRLGLVLALVQEGRLTIDSFHNQPETYTGDKAFYHGHFYSDKAIGTSILGAIIYLPLHWLSQLIHYELSFKKVHYFLTLFTVGLLSAFAGSLIYVLCEYACQNRLHSYVVTLAITLGTMYLPYSTVFYGHQLAGSLLFIAFFMIYKLKLEPRSDKFIHLLLIGLLLGFALITEYTTAIIVLPLIFYYFYALRRMSLKQVPNLIIIPIIGGLIPVAINLIYNTLCFDSPFSTGYSHLVPGYYQEGMRRGLMGIGWPQLAVLYYITIHPARGLFIQSPVLIASLIGFFFIFKDREWRVEGVLSALALTIYLIINAGYFTWWGGWTFGPRHLIPMLPFLSLPLIFFTQRFFYVVVILSVLSMLQMFIVTAQNLYVPGEIFHLMEKDKLTVNILPFFSFSPIYICLKKLTSGEYGFNLGQWFGLSGFVSIIPPIVILVGVSAIFVVQARRKT